MTYKLFIDDERVPYNPDEWIVVRTAQKAIEYVSKHGMPLVMSLDHDKCLMLYLLLCLEKAKNIIGKQFNNH